MKLTNLYIYAFAISSSSFLYGYKGIILLQLAKLQARFGHDERFKLDARFIESGSEDDSKLIHLIASV